MFWLRGGWENHRPGKELRSDLAFGETAGLEEQGRLRLEGEGNDTPSAPARPSAAPLQGPTAPRQAAVSRKLGLKGREAACSRQEAGGVRLSLPT